MDAPQINLQINLDGLPARIQRALKALTNLVAIGLNAETSITKDSLLIPDVIIHHSYDSENQWDTELAKSVWKYWILRNGFRDAAETISGLLEEIQTVLAYWKLSEIQSRHGQLIGDDWNLHVVKKSHQFHKKTIPQKIEFLEKEYQFSPDTDLLRQVLSINVARNCYVHRNGIVTAGHDTGPSGFLEVEWTALVVMMIVDGHEQELIPPQIIESETTVGVANRVRTKCIAVGDSLEFNSIEFSQIGWTLFLFSKSCADRLYEYAKERGIQFSPPAT